MGHAQEAEMSGENTMSEPRRISLRGIWEKEDQGESVIPDSAASTLGKSKVDARLNIHLQCEAKDVAQVEKDA
jgi:hypothetical protein